MSVDWPMLMNRIIWVRQHSVAVVTSVFTLLLVTTFWPGRRATLERHGHIPLDDDR